MSDATHEARTDEAEHSDEKANEDEEAAEEYDHLDGVADGCGCTEVWEHPSEQRDND
jgi:hypothetical protein